MSLFSHRTDASEKATHSSPASATTQGAKWQRDSGRYSNDKQRRAAMPPWVINTGSLIIMGLFGVIEPIYRRGRFFVVRYLSQPYQP